MKIINLIAILSFGISSTIYAQTPKWINYENRHAFYPENKYITGFSSETNYLNLEVSEILEKCKDNAKKSLVESVKVSIKSITVSGTENLNTGNNVATYEYIKHSSVSYSNIDVAGLITETYYDKKKKTAYAFTYVKRTDLISNYKQKVISELQRLEQNYNFASEAIAAGQSQKAIPKLLECLPYFREIEEGQSILAALGVFDEASIQAEKTLALKSKIDKSINELNNSIKTDISDLAYFISNGLKIQKPDLQGSVSLSSFNYQDTKMGSPFSKRLFKELEQKLVSNARFNILSQDLFGANVDLNPYDYIITGTYWEEADYLKVIVVLRNFKTGKAEASIESKLKKDYCSQNSISFLPENFIIANNKNKNFTENEIVGGDLKLEVWTNKGRDNLLYSQGDTLRLYIRANKECYVRFVYYLADGSSVLLLDDFYLGIDKVNKVYQLPDEFICSDPYGAELLQVNAQTERFEPLFTSFKYGYNFITEDIGEIIKKNRGFKKLDDKIMKAENRLVITTMSY
ncbi:MAG: hypothetical protein P1P88_01745 [Bacteroidales bacterium]|nr:hypothetical protein [Bacteroidales bacterium]